MGVDYYNILKISKNACEEDVKKSYKRLAMKWHPDKNSVNTEEAEAKFKQISEAYDVLSDPEKRQFYDLCGEEGLKCGLFSNTSGKEYCGGKGFKFSPRDAEDIFEEFFGGLNDGKGMSSGGDGGGGRLIKAAAVESKLPCSLEELYKGSKRKMQISRTVLDGNGKPRTIEELVTILIKPGWKKGTKITFPEKGNHESGRAPGDLIFVVDEKAHPIFRRDGNDLVVYQKISLVDALTGKTLHLTTLDGRDLEVPISYIVKPGHELVIQNEGMPLSKEPGEKGNLRIKFDVKFPSRLSSDQKSDLKSVLGSTTG